VLTVAHLPGKAKIAPTAVGGSEAPSKICSSRLGAGKPSHQPYGEPGERGRRSSQSVPPRYDIPAKPRAE